jgi:hypothetical protein
MGQKQAAWLLVALGAALLALSALAEPLGLGDNDGVGWKQTTGMVVGGLVLVAGLALAYVRRGSAGSPQAEI